MNLAIHGINGDLSARWEDTFYADKHPDLKADFILANPPFNMSDWARKTDDPRWRYGVPPAGNANFAWLQHIVYKLAERGRPAWSSPTARCRRGSPVRARSAPLMVEADLVACMVALPPQLFRTTQIPACLWFFAKDKGPQAAKRLTDRRGEILFIDARTHGHADQPHRARSSPTTTSPRSPAPTTPGAAPLPPAQTGLTYEDMPGFCYSANLDGDPQARPRTHAWPLRRRGGDRRHRWRANRREDRPPQEGTLRPLRRVRPS